MKALQHSSAGIVLMLLAGLAACERLTGPPRFVAVGKVICGPAPAAGSKGNVMVPQEFYGTQIELLESGELRRRALERVRALNPELRESDVEIRVTQTKGSSILNVAATGEEPKYTRIFCGAILDEYVAFRKELIEKSLGSSVNKVIEEVLKREKQVQQLSTKLFDGKKAGLPALDLEKLKEDYDRAREDYQDWKKTLDRMVVSANLDESIVIMERPIIAVETR